ncbi:MAG: hypothetical protein ACLTDR_09030 [Adlercreutzia equolifaciens]
MPRAYPARTGEILYEAMPWLKQVTGKTIVIKYGGSAMENPQLAAEVMADIVLLKILGVNPVLVHGGGKAINRAFAKFDLPVEFVDGQRVTTDDAMDLVRMVLTGEVNQQLVEAMNAHGNMGVGVREPTPASSWPSRPTRGWGAWARSRASIRRSSRTWWPTTIFPSSPPSPLARTVAATT